MELVKDIKVALDKENASTYLVNQQWENEARICNITLMNQGGEYQIPLGTKVILQFDKADRKSVIKELDYLDNKISLSFTSQMCAYPGKAAAQISLYNGETILRTPIMHFNIAGGMISQENIASENEIAIVDDLIKKAQQAEELYEKVPEILAEANEVIEEIEAFKNILGDYYTKEQADATLASVLDELTHTYNASLQQIQSNLDTTNVAIRNDLGTAISLKADKTTADSIKDDVDDLFRDVEFLQDKIKWTEYTALNQIGLSDGNISAAGSLSRIVEAMTNYSTLSLRVSSQAWSVLLPYNSGILTVKRGASINTSKLYFEPEPNASYSGLEKFYANYYDGITTGSYANKISSWQLVLSEEQTENLIYSILRNEGII